MDRTKAVDRGLWTGWLKNGCGRTSSMAAACWRATRHSPSSPSSRWRSASARTARFSASRRAALAAAAGRATRRGRHHQLDRRPSNRSGLAVNATHVVHSGVSGNNGGYHANPAFLEGLPNESLIVMRRPTCISASCSSSRVRHEGWTQRQAAGAAGMSVRTVAKWLARRASRRPAGPVVAAASATAPPRLPRKPPSSRVRRTRATAWEISRRARLPRSTVTRVLAPRRASIGVALLEPPAPVPALRVAARRRPAPCRSQAAGPRGGRGPSHPRRSAAPGARGRLGVSARRDR